MYRIYIIDIIDANVRRVRVDEEYLKKLILSYILLELLKLLE